MEHTPAIALHYIRYRETSVIARFFTEKFGIQSFLVPGIRTARPRIPLAFFSPLHVCEITQTHLANRDLQRIRDIRTLFPLSTIPFSPVKSAMAMFVAEVLTKVLGDHQPHAELFSITLDWTLELDKPETGTDHVLLAWLWLILGPLGLKPATWMDLVPPHLQAGVDQPERLGQYFEGLESGHSALPSLSGKARQWLLDVMLVYLQRHLEGMGSLRSLSVLRQVL